MNNLNEFVTVSFPIPRRITVKKYAYILENDSEESVQLPRWDTKLITDEFGNATGAVIERWIAEWHGLLEKE